MAFPGFSLLQLVVFIEDLNSFELAFWLFFVIESFSICYSVNKTTWKLISIDKEDLAEAVFLVS